MVKVAIATPEPEWTNFIVFPDGTFIYLGNIDKFIEKINEKK